MTIKLVLVGPHAGKNILLHHHNFKKGVVNIQGTVEANKGLIRFMSKSYNAHVENSKEYEHAVDEYAKALKESGDATQELQGSVQSERKGSTEEETTQVGGSTEVEQASESGLEVSEGDRQEDSGDDDETTVENLDDEMKLASPVNYALEKAVRDLDPENDKHWTQAGLPAISAIVEAIGSGEVTRADIKEVAPDWTRDMSREERNLLD